MSYEHRSNIFIISIMNEPFLFSNLIDLQDLDNEIFKLIAEKSEGESVNILKDRAYYENNLSCYEELITNHQDNLTINEIVKMSSKLFDYDFFITSENLLSIAIKRNNELPKVKELIYKQFYYHTRNKNTCKH